MMFRTRLTRALACVGLVAVSASCATEASLPESAVDSEEFEVHCADDERGPYRWWANQRAERDAELQAHIDSQPENFDKYRSMPAGTVGIPAIIFRLLPDVFPEIWGTPESNFAAIGLMSDEYNPNAVLPLGLGHIPGASAVPTPSGDVHFRVVGMTCATCHTGRVEHPDGRIESILGAPATEFKYHQYRAMVVGTANHPNFTAANFLAALETKPMGWLYNDPALMVQEATERAVFAVAAAPMLDAVRNSANAGAAHAAQTLLASTYAGPNAPDLTQAHPGQMDAMGGFAAMATNPALFDSPEEVAAVLPPSPALVDQMYIWRIGDRPNTKWGGEVVDPVHSLAGAAMGMIGTPQFVHMEAINASAEFAWDLPAKPYPFPVHRAKAAIGKRLYQNFCADCHAPGNDNILSPDEVGTDSNRAHVFTDYTIAGLRQMIRIACSDPVTCTEADGSPIPDENVMRMTEGYAALPLDGIWARAPYFHNGSVPTLRALLTGDRPVQFYRGNISYDQDGVGFTWDEATGEHAFLYDTTIDGNSNIGHDSAAFTGGVDWAAHPFLLDALLEYLKTL